MQVEVELVAFLKKYAPGDKAVFDLELPDNATVGTIVQRLAIPAEEAWIVLVNGRHGGDETALKDGDAVALLTPVEGG